ncbi:MAG: DNA-binding protein WhiA [Eubacterium sp.]|nr:DNA-binding protein WhiA [Eubacterium sp.]
MSFSSDVKRELSGLVCEDPHECASELAALILFGGEVRRKENGSPAVVFHTENPLIAERFRKLAKVLGISIRQGEAPHTYTVEDDSMGTVLLKTCGLLDNLGRIVDQEDLADNHLLQINSCQRAFLRGAFLASGSVTDPNKNYHFEITCDNEILASLLRQQLEYFGLDAKTVRRKKYLVVYIKEGAMISDILAVMSGHISKLNFENIRIYKDVRNVVNRRVNCETANINKTVSASRKQIEDIRYIQETIGFGRLPEPLKEVACARLEEPSASLKELGQSLEPPVGKSGVNHRLRKLSQIAQDIRDKRSIQNKN